MSEGENKQRTRGAKKVPSGNFLTPKELSEAKESGKGFDLPYLSLEDEWKKEHVAMFRLPPDQFDTTDTFSVFSLVSGKHLGWGETKKEAESAAAYFLRKNS
jgi:hypothetical protein